VAEEKGTKEKKERILTHLCHFSVTAWPLRILLSEIKYVSYVRSHCDGCAYSSLRLWSDLDQRYRPNVQSLPSHPASAPPIRSLRHWRSINLVVCMYVCMYVITIVVVIIILFVIIRN